MYIRLLAYYVDVCI